ncbi:Fanconi anemia group G protein isoform X2 [Sceloporus undulatus]|uniref:Fanconi anemia group G protein isoform X2 n=1 Tax=Sceloporus undulatus TaxID=8520 RepID=UPI001C4B4961|nr:Fanconi anemia group G protein isoform X2 [Sceloporus undulatus]
MATRSSGSDCSVTQTAQQCRLAFTKLLQKIQGLPAALPALPLELTVLYNALLFDINLSSSSDEELLTLIDHGLSRVLEACSVSDRGVCSEECWERILQGRIPEELQASLHRLAALQAALWLMANRLEAVEGLFRILSGAKDLGASCPGSQNELLSLLQTWNPCDMEGSDPLVAQSLQDLKEMLWTSAAFLQGIQKLEAGDSPAALAFLQAAAAGLSSKRVLAQTFTLMGCCTLKLGKPQVAMQHLRRALQVDFTFLPALYQAALLYRQLDLLEAELESLTLLYQALDGPAQVTRESVQPCFLIRIEHLVRSSRLSPFFVQKCPSGVKYLLAQRCLQARRVWFPVLNPSPAFKTLHRAKCCKAFLLGLSHPSSHEKTWQELTGGRSTTEMAMLQQCEAPVVSFWLLLTCPFCCRANEAAEHYLDLLAMLQEGPLQQVCQSGELALPRIPEVFLEAASALEELAKNEDAIVVCEEVVMQTSKLIPKKLRIGPGLRSDEDVLWAKSPSIFQKQESLCCILWRAAAYLLQGWGWARQGEVKEAISHFSRSLDDLLRVHFVSPGGSCNSSTEENWEQMGLPEAKVLGQIRQLALTGRGAQFLELGQEKKALMDFQYSLHICPDNPSANLYFLHTLWKLGRRQEAAAHWQMFLPKSALMDEMAEGSFPLYLQPCVRQMKFPHVESLTSDMKRFLEGNNQEP